MRFIRVVIVGLAGALMSMAAIAAPVEHAPSVAILTAAAVEVKAAVPQPNFGAPIHLAVQANHATASASAERTREPAPAAAGAVTCPASVGPAFALRSSRDPLDDPHPDPDDGKAPSIARLDPDDSDGGDESDGRLPLAA